MSLNDKKNRQYKSDFGSLGGKPTESKSSSKSKESSSKKDYDEKKSSSSSRKHAENDDDRKSRGHRSLKNDDEATSYSRHRSRPKDVDVDDEKKSSKSHHRKKDVDEEEARERDKGKEKGHHRSKHRDDNKEVESRGHHRDHKSERRKHRDDEDNSDRGENGKRDETADEPKYEEDFDDDFEKESSEEEKVVVRKDKKSDSSSTKKQPETNNYSSDDQEYRKKAESKTNHRSSNHQNSRTHNKYDDYDDYNDTNERGRIVKANAHVKLPTELVEVHASDIHFSHDSVDRQKRRANDLVAKNMIELDRKAFSLLDINPIQMRTVYSSHLKHEKVQTNDDTLEIEVQTDEIEMSTRWTQHPADDLKGYGIEDQKFDYDVSSDILEKFRIDVNLLSLQQFLQKSSKVIEAILRENSSQDEQKLLAMTKSDLDFSQGFSLFSIPKYLAKLTQTAILTNVVFSHDEPSHLVCSYDLDLNGTSSTLLIVWNIDDPSMPYRVLVCETTSTCLCYFSFIVVSGNIDGSIVLWDLRESSSLHSRNLKKISESHVVRAPTYATAGVLLEENHLSEVKSILTLQNQTKEGDNGVFMQLATLEIDCKLIIWTVVELKNIDLAVFETDLGLLPGGKIQLVKSYEITLNNIIKTVFGRSEYQTWNMTVSASQKNHFYISTNIGQIIHIERKGKSFASSVMKSNYADLSGFFRVNSNGGGDHFLIDDTCDGLLSVKNVSFHHEISDILLASYGNGEIRLYDVNYATPIKTWHFMMGNEIKEIKWIESRSSCFSVLDEAESKLLIWDLLADDTQPVLVKKIKNFGGICFPTIRTSKVSLGSGQEMEKVPFAYFERNSVDLQVHLFTAEWTRKSDKEAKKFAKLIKNYLVAF